MRMPGPSTTNVGVPQALVPGSSFSPEGPAEVSTLNSKKPVFTSQQAGKQLTRGGYKVHDNNGDGKTTLSYRVAKGFTPQQAEQARQAMQSWQDVANVTFTEKALHRDGHVDINDMPDSSGGVASLPHRYMTQTSANIGTQNVGANPSPGHFFRMVLVHELGHALGLEHPGNYDGNGNYGRHATYAGDTQARSVMSYFSEKNQPGHDFKSLYPSAPMMDDIAAAQKLYGANTKTRNTDTTYGFNSNTNREALSLKSANDNPIFCVWDGGGNDTLDFSGYSQNQKINLNAESFSDVGALKGNVSVAKGVILENAVGGKGNDALIGNAVANRLKGGGGADRLSGGGGADTFVYDHASDSTPDNPDVILDFQSGSDKIDVRAVLKQANLSALKYVERLTGQPGQAVISYNQGSNEGSLALDLTGNGKADLLIKSLGQIKAGDVLALGDTPTANPEPKDPKPAPRPQPEEPKPKPEPKPKSQNRNHVRIRVNRSRVHIRVSRSHVQIRVSHSHVRIRMNRSRVHIRVSRSHVQIRVSHNHVRIRVNRGRDHTRVSRSHVQIRVSHSHARFRVSPDPSLVQIRVSRKLSFEIQDRPMASIPIQVSPARCTRRLLISRRFPRGVEGGTIQCQTRAESIQVHRCYE